MYMTRMMYRMYRMYALYMMYTRFEMYRMYGSREQIRHRSFLRFLLSAKFRSEGYVRRVA